MEANPRFSLTRALVSGISVVTLQEINRGSIGSTARKTGFGDTPGEAYEDWASKCPRMVVETPKHWSGPCQDGGKWRLT